MSQPGRPKFASWDANQKEIIHQLKFLGFDVDVISDLGGLYDLVVTGEKIIQVEGWGRTYVICSCRPEIKTPGKDYNENEKEYHYKQNFPENHFKAYSYFEILRWFGWSLEEIEEGNERLEKEGLVNG